MKGLVRLARRTVRTQREKHGYVVGSWRMVVGRTGQQKQVDPPSGLARQVRLDHAQPGEWALRALPRTVPSGVAKLAGPDRLLTRPRRGVQVPVDDVDH